MAASVEYVTVGGGQNLARSVTIRRGFEGPQIVLDWLHPQVPVLEVTAEDSFEDFGDAASTAQVFQTFELIHDVRIARIDLKLARIGLPIDNIKVDVYTTSAGDPDTLLASATVLEGRLLPEKPSSGTISATAFVIEFANQPLLTKNTKYAIVVSRSGALDLIDHYSMRVEATGTYLKGNFGVGTPVPVWTGGSEDALFSLFERGTVSIRRQLFENPVAIDDGAEIFSGNTVESFSDIIVSGQEVQYYTFFTNDGVNQFFSISTQVHELVTDNQDFPDRLFQRLPEVYRNRDLESTQLILRTQTLPATGGEQFNWLDDRTERGELERFLKMFGLELGLIRELGLSFGQFRDIDEMDTDLLDFMAQYLGWTKIPDVSVERQRFLIKNAIFLYQTAGTQAGIENLIVVIFGVTPTAIIEFRNNLLITNTVGSDILDFDPGNLAKIGLTTDDIDRISDLSPNGQFSFRGLGIFLPLLASEISDDLISVLRAYFDQLVGATLAWFVFAGDGSGGFVEVASG